MPRPPVIAFVSLGCAKNLVDSEVMLARLAEAGCAPTSDLEDADVIVVNTCGFLDEARQEALEVIEEAAACKTRGRCRRLVVVGCLVQRDRDELRQAVPEIDVLLGVHERERVVQAVLDDRPDPIVASDAPHEAAMPADTARLRITPRTYAYLRIAEGCDQHCTFCTIPMIRGPMRSKPINVVLDEAVELRDDGVVELNVIAQDTTAYGMDIPGSPRLHELLRGLDAIEGIGWVRLMYAYPRHFDDELIDAIAEADHVVPYVDLPLQHISDRVLRRMGRRVTRLEIETLLDKLRDRVPSIHIRTTLMVGFPGETDDDFAELLRFVEDRRFDALGVFAYSHEPETPAARLDDPVDNHAKQERLDAIMTAQQAIAFAKTDGLIGRRFPVLIEGVDPEKRLTARHAGQAPEVDSVVLLTDAPSDDAPWIEVACVARQGYDLIARPARGILSPLE